MASQRCIIEVLKWLSAEEILKETSIVSQFWYQMCELDEVWISHYEDEGLVPIRPENSTFKEGYRLSQTGRNDLAILDHNTFTLFDCKKMSVYKQFDHLPPLSDVYQCAAVLLFNGSVLCCGGYENSRRLSETCLIQSNKPTMSCMDMTSARNFHSIILYKRVAYVFGGTDLPTAEKLMIDPLDSLSVRNWEKLPDMLSKHIACNPCLQSELIYLCGGNTTTAEVFNAVSQTYHMLPFKLPEALYGCVTLLENGEFTIISSNFVSVWTPGKTLQSSAYDGYPGIWTCMKQCKVGSAVYSAENGQVRVFDLDTKIRENLNWSLR